MKQTIKKIYNFFVQDDTKIKIECTTRSFWDSKRQVRVIQRRFNTFRSFRTFVWWSITKNPYEKAKKYLENVQTQPAYALRLGAYFAVFLIGVFADLKNVSNVTLVAGAIAFDATANTTNNTTSPTSFSHTCTGSNLVLAVSVASYRGLSSCTYNSVGMTLGPSASLGQAKTGVYYLGSPATGANTVSFSASSSGCDDVCAISFSGADTATPNGTQGTNTASSSTTISKSITTDRANSFIVDAVATEQDAAHVYGADAGQTGRMWGQLAFWIGGGASTKPTTTTGSYTMGWTKSSGTTAVNLSISVLEIHEASAATTNFLSLLGVGT